MCVRHTSRTMRDAPWRDAWCERPRCISRAWRQPGRALQHSECSGLQPRHNALQQKTCVQQLLCVSSRMAPARALGCFARRNGSVAEYVTLSQVGAACLLVRLVVRCAVWTDSVRCCAESRVASWCT